MLKRKLNTNERIKAYHARQKLISNVETAASEYQRAVASIYLSLFLIGFIIMLIKLSGVS